MGEERFAGEAQRAGDGPIGVPVRAKVVQQLAKLGERQRAGPATVPDPLQDRVIPG